MKKIFAILFFTGYCFSVNAQTESEQQVQKTVKEMFEALSNRDTNGIKIHCTKDILLFENGAIWNLDTLIQKTVQNTSADFKRVNTIDFINTVVEKNTAWTTYNNQAEITRNGQHIFIKWLESAILVKEDKAWKIKVLHSTLTRRN